MADKKTAAKPAEPKGADLDVATLVQRLEALEEKNRQLEAKAQQPEPDPSADEQQKTTKCKTTSSERLKPGSKATRWGHAWTVGKDGVSMTAEIPEYDVLNGTRGGRWQPVDMTDDEADKLYFMARYEHVMGDPPPVSMTVDQMRAKVHDARQQVAA